MSLKQIFIGVAALVVVAGGLLLAQGTGLGRGKHANRLDRMKEFVATYLDLSEGQKAQAEQIFANARESAKPLVAEMRKDRESLVEAVKAGDGQAIERISQSGGALMGRVMSIHGKAAAEFYKTLTAEQKAKAEKLHGQFRGMWGRPFGGM